MIEFSPKKYLSDLWQHIPQDGFVSIYELKVPNLDSAPVTLADHIAAEAEARLQAEARISNGPDDDQMPELQDEDGKYIYQYADAIETRSWAMDVELDCNVWEYVAQQMLDFMFPDEAKKARAYSMKLRKKYATKKAA